MERHYQAIVIGCGGVGSAALYHLAQRGVRVLGIDRFGIAHDRGSSHGQTRVIRMAYYEHPNYVPLLQRSYQLWHELEQSTGLSLFHRVGLIQVGSLAGEVIPGVLRSAHEYELPIEQWTREEAAKRCPVLNVPQGAEVIVERNAGYLMVEECVRAHAELARSRGAAWVAPCVVEQVASEDRAIRIVTDHGSFTCDRAIIAGGAWSGELLRDANLPLEVRRKHLHWYPTDDPGFLPDRCPVFVFEVEDRFFYGFPRHGGGEIKVAQHLGGEVIADPTHVSRDIDDQEQAEVNGFVARYLRGVSPEPSAHAVCMYTMTHVGDGPATIHAWSARPLDGSC